MAQLVDERNVVCLFFFCPAPLKGPLRLVVMNLKAGLLWWVCICLQSLAVAEVKP